MSFLDVSPTVLGERLRRARSNSGLTQDAAAGMLKIARTTLVAIERGQRRVKPDELTAFASLYDVSVGRLTSPDAIHVDLTAKFRRSEALQAGPDVATAVALLNRLATGATEVERAVGIELRQDYPPPIRIRPNGLYQQAEDAAVALRQRLGVGLGPIGDLLSLFELELGIRVFARPLAHHISGLYAYDPAVGACVLINALHRQKRRTQSLAHEGGHFIADRAHADVLEDFEVVRTVEERFARRFGPALLMPASTVRERFDQIVSMEQAFSLRQLVLLSHQFGVSSEAMARRLEELDLLADGTWQSLKERKFDSTFERDVIGDPAPELTPPLVAPRLAYLSSVAIERGVLSEGQLCDLLVVDRVQLRECLAAFPPSVGNN